MSLNLSAIRVWGFVFLMLASLTVQVLSSAPRAAASGGEDEKKSDPKPKSSLLEIPTPANKKETIGNTILSDEIATAGKPFEVTFRFKKAGDAGDFRTAVLRYEQDGTGKVIYWHMAGNPSTNSITGAVSVSFRTYGVSARDDDRGTGKGKIIITQSESGKLVDYVLLPESFKIKGP